MIGRRTAYRAAAAGQLPVIRIGRRVVVNRARLLAFIDGQQPPPELALALDELSDVIDALGGS